MGITARTLIIGTVVVLFGGICLGADPKKEDLPDAEKAIMDTWDHWHLGFYDQVRRFQTAERKFKSKLGAKAPTKFMVGLQNSLDKTPLNKYWFKGRYDNTVKLAAARNEYESFQVAAIPYMGKELETVALEAADLKQSGGSATIKSACVNIYRVGRVKMINSLHPYAMSDQMWPDPLIANGQQAAKKMDLALFWVEINIPKDTAPGDYSGELQLSGDGEKVPVTPQFACLWLHASGQGSFSNRRLDEFEEP